MKQKIITKTALFVSIVIFVTIFTNVFGEANSLVGVSTVIASLVLLEKNLTNNPLTCFLELLITNLLIGILTFVASQNIWIGIIINFVSIFSIGYIFSYNISKKLIIPFGLQYLFILHVPVQSSELGLRLTSLACGAIIVMIIQFIVHAKKEKNPETEESLLFTEGEDDHDDAPITILGKVYNIHPVRASYATRVALLTSLLSFISMLLGLEQGRWMVFTAFSITEFCAEHCKVKSRDRMHGTLIGAFIVLIAFLIIKDNTLRGFIVLMAGYLNPFAENYKDTMICVTVSSIASVALTNGTLITAMERIIYVGIGIAIGLLVNKYVMKQQLCKQEKKNL